MSARIGPKFAMLLLVAGGCGSGRSGAAGATGGAGGPGTGAAGTGIAGTGAAGTGAVGTGAAGTGAAGTGAAGTGAAGTGAAGTGAGGAGWLTPPAMAPALVAPAGARVKVHVHAVGAQVYSCAASGGGGADGGAPTYVWAFKAPDAKLYDSSGAQVGTHGAGPSWTASDGSVANGTKVIELPSPLPDAISWLLLRVSSTSGAGVFSDVTYVQRLDTTGGRAPVTGCDATTVGMDLRVSYTAEYYFYAGGGAPSWLVPPIGLPAAIATPMGLTLKVHDHGIGMQIYACTASGGDYAWVFKAPDALLYDQNYIPVGLHGEGPSWTSSDGSSLSARVLAQVDSPLPDAIPWLLLKELSTTGVGEFDNVGIVQRLNTAGGKAPTNGCDATTVDTIVRVPYSADYYFYVDYTPPDSGTAD